MELIWILGVALLINIFVFLIAFIKQTDKLTDITYAFTFVAVALVVYSTTRQSAVSLIAIVMVGLWAARLGSFLARRIRRIGRDKRFDEIRPSFWKFGRFWSLQGLSVWIIMIPSVYLIDAAPKSFKLLSIVGIIIWLIGLVIEAVADNQKASFTQKAANRDKWIETGLWKYSRHPNYLGEMMVWIGICLYALSYLTGWSAVVSLASPLWISGLLLFVTGIPTTEASADKKWGKLSAYQDYKKRVSVLVPKL